MVMVEWVITVKFLRNINSVSELWFRQKKKTNWKFDLEKPAIDRLLDYLSNQESRKPAIDILIQEYLEKIGSPLTYQSSHISPLMNISM